MKVESCESSGPKVIVVPEPIGCCIFVQIDSWDQDKYPKDCETMYILSDKAGAYFWNGSEWVFLTFGASGDFVTNGTFEAFKTSQGTRDDEQDTNLTDLEKKVVKSVNGIKPDASGNVNITSQIQVSQIRTTVDISGIADSDIFNKSVVSKADLLWTKYTMAGGNLVLVTGEFQVVAAQSTSYANLFWTTPKGFELLDLAVVAGQFVDIMQFSPLTNASLNAMVKVNGTLGWSNYGSIPAGYYTINKTLRAL